MKPLDAKARYSAGVLKYARMGYFEGNPGFRSRITQHIDFPDHEDGELMIIREADVRASRICRGGLLAGLDTPKESASGETA